MPVAAGHPPTDLDDPYHQAIQARHLRQVVQRTPHPTVPTGSGAGAGPLRPCRSGGPPCDRTAQLFSGTTPRREGHSAFATPTWQVVPVANRRELARAYPDRYRFFGDRQGLGRTTEIRKYVAEIGQGQGEAWAATVATSRGFSRSTE